MNIEKFDTLCEQYLITVYSNVVAYHSIKANENDDGLVVNGTFYFKSGKEKNTSFIFKMQELTKRGKTKFVGYNSDISGEKKIFTMTGEVENNTFTPKSFIYKYRAKDTTGVVCRLYGNMKG